MFKNKGIRFITQAAIIAALYVALTLAIKPLAYGPLQIRFSEALNVLPYFTPAAVPGLAIGCFIANIPSDLGPIDMFVGGGATLLAAFLASKIKIKWLVPLPAVLINAVAVGIMLSVKLELPLWGMIGSVAVGQVIACYIVGMPLLLLLKRYGKKLFPKNN